MSAKKLDSRGRFRSKTISFRISPEETEQLDVKVKLSGMTKQDYLVNRVLQKEIVVQPNPRVYKALKNQLEAVLEELKRIGNGGVDDGTVGNDPAYQHHTLRNKRRIRINVNSSTDNLWGCYFFAQIHGLLL